MDTNNFIKSLNSLSDQELFRVKDNLVEQLNAVESLRQSRWKAEEHSAIINDLSHNGKFEVVTPVIDFEVPAQSTSHPEREVPREWTRDDIDAKLRASDQAVEAAIIRLFELQTAGEQRTAGTHCQNDAGFNAADAKAGTRFARWLLGMDDRNVVKYPKKSLNHPRASRIFGRYCQDGGTVMDRARKIALKHSAQLVTIANAK